MKNSFVLLFLLSGHTFFYGQMQSFQYAKEVKDVQKEWHKIVIPKEVFGKVSQNLSDIRIFGITKNRDTIEAPYIINVESKKSVKKPITFKKLNTSKNDKGYFFTFEVPKAEITNQIQLEFGVNNFDWELRLEGSQDQKEWFTIKDDYRVLSFQNGSTDYKFTTISFPDAKYFFYRILVRSEEDPELSEASVSHIETKEGSYVHHAISNQRIIQNKKERQTELILDLEQPGRVSYVQILPKDTFDYYRPITIQYVSDSIKTEKGWKYSYQNLYKGTLTSIEPNEFIFQDTTVKKLRIIVDNGDNEPLTFGDSKVKGYKHELIARFTKPANYFLVYGNKSARKPAYDIKKFRNNIPASLVELKLDNEYKIENKTSPKIKPLFENKFWLWGIMGLLILLLGGFSLKMISQKK